MPRWFRITLAGVALTALCLTVLYVYVIWSVQNSDWTFTKANDAHFEARTDFLASFEGQTCLTQDTILAEAARRNFEVYTLERPLMWCHRPTGLTNWIGVEVRPAMSFSTRDETSEFFGFDQSGCSIAWEDASGPGTTCPDG